MVSTHHGDQPAPHVDPAAFAAAQRHVFAGKRLRIGRSSTVHGVAFRPWLNGLTLPAPTCRQGWSGVGASGELVATTAPVSCRKCRRMIGDPGGGQTALFETGTNPRSADPA